MGIELGALKWDPVGSGYRYWGEVKKHNPNLHWPLGHLWSVQSGYESLHNIISILYSGGPCLLCRMLWIERVHYRWPKQCSMRKCFKKWVGVQVEKISSPITGLVGIKAGKIPIHCSLNGQHLPFQWKDWSKTKKLGPSHVAQWFLTSLLNSVKPDD